MPLRPARAEIRDQEPAGEQTRREGRPQTHVGRLPRAPQTPARRPPRQRIDPRTDEPQKPALAPLERPERQARRRDLAQRVGAQRKQHHQPIIRYTNVPGVLQQASRERGRNCCPPAIGSESSRGGKPGPSALRIAKGRAIPAPPRRAFPPDRNSGPRAIAASRRRRIPHIWSLADHHDLVRDLFHHGENVRREEHRHPAARHRLQQVAHDLRGHRIDGLEGLVEKQHLGIGQQGHGERGLLAHAVGAGCGEGVAAVFQAQGVQQLAWSARGSRGAPRRRHRR